jgi:ABC-type transport system involved in multi-copper enzyme maturation permease subunit
MTPHDVALAEHRSGSESAAAAGPLQPWQAAEALLERWSERLNPILVKEARQALKSRQFSITFSLLLICGWLWSLGGIAVLMPSVYYLPSGSFMLIGYYFIFAVPLLVIVPFSAFRSLAAEREDGTYELLSITALSSRQIVTGKLGSALLQMIVYYAALAPCVAFTYLLRGIDIFTISGILFYTFLVSVLLSVVGLMFAGLSRSRLWQALISVALLLVLLGALWLWSVGVVSVLVQAGQMPFDEPVFWLVQLCILTLYATYVLLFVLAAAAQNSFASDNRSTRLRIVMLVQLVLWSAWMLYFWMRFHYVELPLIMLSLVAVHWMIYGALMVGEGAELSPRAKRSLPQTFLGRMFLTWFNPGSGTGYVFAVITLLVLIAVTLMAGVAAKELAPNNYNFGSLRTDRFVPFCLLLWGYYACYLGAGRLLVMAVRRTVRFGLLLSVLICALLLALGAVVPAFAQFWLQSFRDLDYSSLQVTNWMWTLVHCLDRGIGAHSEVVAIVVLAALLMLGLNLLLAVREVEHVRDDAPQRVRQDDQERAAKAVETSSASA